MRRKLVLLAALVLSAGTGWAACSLDKTGIERNDWEDLPNGFLDATGARTLDDFVNAAANQLFLTEQGSNIIVEGLLFMVGPFGPVGFAYKDPPPIYFPGYACNEIGQCFNTQLTVMLTGEPDQFMNGLADFISGGLISPFNTDFFVRSYEIVVEDAEGNISDIRDFRPYTIVRQQQLKERYSLSTDDLENVDMRCRDNFGNLTYENPVAGGVSGETLPLLWEIDIPPPSLPSTWVCWETDTGVACRRVESYPTVQ